MRLTCLSVTPVALANCDGVMGVSLILATISSRVIRFPDGGAVVGGAVQQEALIGVLAGYEMQVDFPAPSFILAVGPLPFPGCLSFGESHHDRLLNVQKSHVMTTTAMPPM